MNCFMHTKGGMISTAVAVVLHALLCYKLLLEDLGVSGLGYALSISSLI